MISLKVVVSSDVAGFEAPALWISVLGDYSGSVFSPRKLEGVQQENCLPREGHRQGYQVWVCQLELSWEASFLAVQGPQVTARLTS